MDNLLEFPKIFDRKTGEVLPVNQLKSKKIENFLQSLTTKEVSTFLTKINFIRKIAEKVEDATKNYVKNKVGDFEGEIFFEDWRIRKQSFSRFDEQELLNSGNKRDIDDWKRLKAKYTKKSEYIKFG